MLSEIQQHLKVCPANHHDIAAVNWLIMAASGQQIMESTLLSINPGVQHGDVNITEVTSDQEPDQTRMVDLECPNCKVKTNSII